MKQKKKCKRNARGATRDESLDALRVQRECLVVETNCGLVIAVARLGNTARNPTMT